MRPSLSLFALLLACGDKDSATTETPTDTSEVPVVTDVDEDGFPAAVDCNDGDAATYPGAPEAEGDGKDADCDGEDDPPAGVTDLDEDGFPAAVDCDDGDATVYPGADDAAGDGIDQDCDGADDAPSADADGDGYANFDFHGTDCDDEDPMVHPDAVETVGDDVDQDCDGADFDARGLVAGDLVITEIMYDADVVSDADGEWFEVVNTTAHTINLRGLLGADDPAFGEADIFTVDADLLIAPGQRLVLGVNGDTSQNGQIPVDFDYAGGGVNLNNAADDLLIGVSAAGAVTVIDQVAWDELAGWPMAKGFSIELADDAVDATENDAATAWCLATALTDSAVDHGSPGEPSSGC